jgi:ATP-dependent DNA helicase RecG
MESTEDGFAIAEKDLEIRGPGDFFGTRQWGMPTFRVAHLIRDRDLLERARTEAFRLVGDGGVLPPSLAYFLEKGGWEQRFGLARVG